MRSIISGDLIADSFQRVTSPHNTLLHATLKGFMTALIFATTSAPARVVCRGHHAGLGHNIHRKIVNFLKCLIFEFYR
jgi:hypothetical protein